jgi:hypothetical protein
MKLEYRLTSLPPPLSTLSSSPITTPGFVGFGMKSLGFRVEDSGFRVRRSDIWIKGSGCQG